MHDGVSSVDRGAAAPRSAFILAAALVLAAVAALLAGCACSTPATSETPKNVVLMIGDGMGVAHMTAAMSEGGSLEMERLTAGGLVTTNAANSFVTDSAASGTAMATGRKTDNGMISVSPDGDTLKTVLEYAEDAGLATGLVATCSVTHATPASFAAHVSSRDDHYEIASQMSRSPVDVLFGGGMMYFLPRSSQGGRTDDADLVEYMRERMSVALTAEEFRALSGDSPAAALLYREHPPRAADRQVTLAEMTDKALDILSDDGDGFFLMVEGSQIDWAGHENDAEWLIEETLDFDEAVGVAMDFAERDGETLVVVTADHECGGYLVMNASLDNGEVTWSEFGSDSHTGTMVPVLGYGPGSAALGGIQDNTSLGRVLIGHVSKR